MDGIVERCQRAGLASEELLMACGEGQSMMMGGGEIMRRHQGQEEFRESVIAAR
jgi:hypothetical protein